MKSFLLRFLLTSIVVVYSSMHMKGYGQQIKKCGFDLLNSNKAVNINYKSLITRFENDTNTYNIPYKIWILGDSADADLMEDIYAEIDSVNVFYKNAKINFFECSSPQYESYSGFRKLEVDVEGVEDLLASRAFNPRVINIYYTDTLMVYGDRVCGLSYMPPGPARIYMDKSCVFSGNTLAHELGHYLGLQHTHGSSNSELTDELVNGDNCAVAGDELCDTPADPNLNDMVVYYLQYDSCAYTGDLTDVNGDFFTPDVRNIMSYSSNRCTDVFSPMQYQHIYSNLFSYGKINLFCDTSVVSKDELISVFPNPFFDEFTVTFQSRIYAAIEVIVFDVFGRKIDISVNGTEDKGVMRLTTSLEDKSLKPGVYFVSLVLNDQLIGTKKLVRVIPSD